MDLAELIPIFSQFQTSEMAAVLGKNIHHIVDSDNFLKLQPKLIYQILEHTSPLEPDFATKMINKIMEIQDIDIKTLLKYVKTKDSSILQKYTSTIDLKEDYTTLNHITDIFKQYDDKIANLESKIVQQEKDYNRQKDNLSETNIRISELEKKMKKFKSHMKDNERHWTSDKEKQILDFYTILSNLNNSFDTQKKSLMNVQASIKGKLDSLSEHINTNQTLRCSTFNEVESENTRKDKQTKEIQMEMQNFHEYIPSKKPSVFSNVFDYCTNGDIQELKRLISNNSRLVTANDSKDNKRPLHIAAENGHYLIAEYLISKGAEIDDRDLIGKTPLFYSVENGYVDICALLLSKGADPNAKDITIYYLVMDQLLYLLLSRIVINRYVNFF